MMAPLAIGRQVHAAPGTGVATYSAALEDAVELLGIPWLAMDAGEVLRGRWPRRLRALLPLARRAVRTDRSIHVPDLFREAQVFFDIHRRPMEIACAGPPGIVHWTYPVPLHLRNWRNLYTVHDAIPLVAAELTPIDSRRHRRLLECLATSAARLVTVSDAAKAEVVEALGCSPALVVNLGQAISVGDVAPPGCLPPPLRPRGYLLHCGTIEPRKNIARLVEAHRRGGVGMPLVLAGPDGWRADEIAPIIAACSGIVRFDYLPRPILLRLIADARALVMPSLAEGFGLPVAEAMALGTPALASDRGALREVAGDAALLVEPTDAVALAKAMIALAGDDDLCEGLARRGLARAATFGLSSFADRLRQLYEVTSG